MFLAPGSIPSQLQSYFWDPITSSCPEQREVLVSTAAENSDKCHHPFCLGLRRELGREAQPGEGGSGGSLLCGGFLFSCWVLERSSLHSRLPAVTPSSTVTPLLHSWGGACGASTFPRWVPASQSC